MRICVFSGTTEGHELSRFLAANGVPAEVFVATEYGAAAMEPMPGITVHEGRLDENEIAARLDADTLLIDATHPYAALVTDNLRTACAKTGARYERLLRPALRHGEGETVPDTEAAVAWLSRHPGKVLLTTGSKELEAYTAVENFAERLYPRVLPSVGVIQKCASLGFPGSHIIAMQGPFSAGMNAALIRQTGAEILVTKDTGATVLTNLTSSLFGTFGTAFLGIVFVIACLNVCTGLIGTCATYFHTRFRTVAGRTLSYRTWQVIFTVFSFIVSNAGLSAIIKVSVPVLSALYPIAIVLVLLTLTHKSLGARFPRVYFWTVLLVGIASFATCISSLVAVFGGSIGWLDAALAMLPLQQYQLGWVVPAILGVAIGIADAPRR